MWCEKIVEFFFNQGEFAVALLYLQQALEIFYTCKDLLSIGRTHYNMANTYLQLTPPNKEKSFEHFTKALEVLTPLFEAEHIIIQNIKNGLTKANALS
jgi:tetratricopeptide (TPR) repeat protein